MSLLEKITGVSLMKCLACTFACLCQRVKWVKWLHWLVNGPIFSMRAQMSRHHAQLHYARAIAGGKEPV